MALLIPADLDQPVRTVSPQNGESFTLQEMYKLLSCRSVEVHDMPDGRYIICDQNGLLVDDPIPNRRIAEFVPIPSVQDVYGHMRQTGADAYLGPMLSADPNAPAFIIPGDVLIVNIERMGHDDETIY